MELEIISFDLNLTYILPPTYVCILRASFCQFLFTNQNIQTKNVITEELCVKLLNQNVACKMLVKWATRCQVQLFYIKQWWNEERRHFKEILKKRILRLKVTLKFSLHSKSHSEFLSLGVLVYLSLCIFLLTVVNNQFADHRLTYIWRYYRYL